MNTLDSLRTAARDAYAAYEATKDEALARGYVGVGVYAYAREAGYASDVAMWAYMDALDPNTFTPAPCPACDTGTECPEHVSTGPWSDSWLTATERKGL